MIQDAAALIRRQPKESHSYSGDHDTRKTPNESRGMVLEMHVISERYHFSKEVRLSVAATTLFASDRIIS
jgi:hypothetical protein